MNCIQKYYKRALYKRFHFSYNLSKDIMKSFIKIFIICVFLASFQDGMVQALSGDVTFYTDWNGGSGSCGLTKSSYDHLAWRIQINIHCALKIVAFKSKEHVDLLCWKLVTHAKLAGMMMWMLPIVFTLYLIIRTKDASRWPGTSSIADQTLQAETESKAYYILFFMFELLRIYLSLQIIGQNFTFIRLIF